MTCQMPFWDDRDDLEPPSERTSNWIALAAIVFVVLVCAALVVVGACG